MRPHLCEGAPFVPMPVLLDRCELNTYNGTCAKVLNSALDCTYEDITVN